MAVRKLPTEPIDEAPLLAFIEDFKKESDRAAVIIGAAKLDLLLYQILHKALQPCTASSDELLDGESALGTFHSRIHMVHRLGLIDDHFARALHLVRRLRNAFAHEPSTSTLDSASHRDRVRELVAPLVPFEPFYIFRANFAGTTTASQDFRSALGLMVVRLDQLLVSCEALNPPCTQTFVAPTWAPRQSS
jgi:hypothetical protein